MANDKNNKHLGLLVCVPGRKNVLHRNFQLHSIFFFSLDFDIFQNEERQILKIRQLMAVSIDFF